MNQQITLAWQGYRYFSYEKRLAEREVQSLLNAQPTPIPHGLSVTLHRFPEPRLDRLTYFRVAHLNGTATLEPQQAKLEATTRVKTSLDLPHVNLPLTRQSTKYSAHGLHEYRGKFNPQIARATLNLLGVAEDALVLDPFCGSGTTLLECAHMGLAAAGVDRSPLGVFISQTKLQAMRVPGTVLAEESNSLICRLLSKAHGLNFDHAFSTKDYRSLRTKSLRELPNREYLQRWFSPSVLAQLEMINAEIDLLDHPTSRNVAQVILSDCLREVSLQEPADLRIRRRKNPRDNYPAIPIFANALRQRTALILRARAILGRVRGRQMVGLADSRHQLWDTITCLVGPKVKFDCVLTSPPYATALPYIDTQRLSIAFLGLASHEDIRELERTLIGNREISTRERDTEELQIDSPVAQLLPSEIVALCRRVYRLAISSHDGFRRRNVPALLFRYFRDMSFVFSQALRLIKPGGVFALIVGPNRTTLAGEQITIDTPTLLALVAEQVGWHQQEIIPLDAYPRFDLHRKNSITTEALVILRS